MVVFGLGLFYFMRLLSCGMLILPLTAAKPMNAAKAAHIAKSAPKAYSGMTNELFTVTVETVGVVLLCGAPLFCIRAALGSAKLPLPWPTARKVKVTRTPEELVAACVPD